ncbi:unnamed protein product [Rotaria sp. Silwood2]|nr:unnamed protein product [Rotaria sp. Silwood2]CAF4460780.1 unnamed protein product [Rotaria sp. Silwood2]
MFDEYLRVLYPFHFWLLLYLFIKQEITSAVPQVDIKNINDKDIDTSEFSSISATTWIELKINLVFFFLLVILLKNIWLTNYTEDILLKLIPKDEIIILGVLVEPFFFIDLIVNKENIPFHLKSIETMIAFNSKYKGRWLDEIRLVPNPLIVNTSFMINIMINEDEGFNISFNEQNFFEFERREQFDVIKHIQVYGNLTLKSVKIIHSSKEGDY